MWEVAFQEYVATSLQVTSPDVAGLETLSQASGKEFGGATAQNFEQWSDYPTDPPPPTPEEDFVAEVTEILTGTGATFDPDDLHLISAQEWESFLAALLGFVSEDHGADQNSYYDDHSDEAPLGDYFIQEWGWLPSVQQMPGYHYFDYLTQDIDPEFLQWAYVVHQGASVFAESNLSLADIENIPFQMMVDGRPITIVWHSGTAPAANLHPDPNDPNHVIVAASNGYFTVQAPPPGSEHTPTALDLMDWTTANYPYMAVVNEAVQYLDDSPLALSVIRAAVQAGVKIVIVTGNARTGYDPVSNSVFWNPAAATLLTNGGIQSPAMGLIHELAHAVGHIANPTFDAQYGNTEDRRVIVEFEQVIAAQLGEPIRDDHFGTYLFDTTVTYHVPAPTH